MVFTDDEGLSPTQTGPTPQQDVPADPPVVPHGVTEAETKTEQDSNPDLNAGNVGAIARGTPTEPKVAHGITAAEEKTDQDLNPHLTASNAGAIATGTVPTTNVVNEQIQNTLKQDQMPAGPVGLSPPSTSEQNLDKMVAFPPPSADTDVKTIGDFFSAGNGAAGEDISGHIRPGN